MPFNKSKKPEKEHEPDRVQTGQLMPPISPNQNEENQRDDPGGSLCYWLLARRTGFAGVGGA
jgi:hypothetical protein